MDPVIERAAKTERCTECDHLEPYETCPLFVITGASGVGKTAILPELRALLPDWDIFETDLLFWGSVKEHMWESWLAIARSISLSQRPVILSGTVLPETLDPLDHRHYFDPIHYLALHCDDQTREARLRALPAWRGWNETRIRDHEAFAKWLLDHAITAFDPPLTIIDTSSTTTLETAERIRDWALRLWSPSVNI